MTDTTEKELINRREAIRRVSIMLGGIAFIGGNSLLSGCLSYHASNARADFSDRDIALLDEVADTILPETDTPGAKAAGVGLFIAVMVTDTYYKDDQAIFRQGMQDLEAECMNNYGSSFLNITSAQRLALVEKLDREQFDYMKTRSAGAPAHYFRMVKELTLLGYFTSETGYTRAMRYVETPGRYDPCVPLAPGGKSWASHA